MLMTYFQTLKKCVCLKFLVRLKRQHLLLTYAGLSCMHAAVQPMLRYKIRLSCGFSTTNWSHLILMTTAVTQNSWTYFNIIALIFFGYNFHFASSRVNWLIVWCSAVRFRFVENLGMKCYAIVNFPLFECDSLAMISYDITLHEWL